MNHLPQICAPCFDLRRNVAVRRCGVHVVKGVALHNHSICVVLSPDPTIGKGAGSETSILWCGQAVSSERSIALTF